MTRSLESFLHGIIDYAGLFPPADLELDPAIRNFARYLREEDAWMLSRFIIPGSRLEELDPFVKELFDGETKLPLSVLGGTFETAERFMEGAEQLAETIGRFCDRHGDAVQADMIEIRLPRELVQANDPQALRQLMDDMATLLNRAPELPDRVFYEVVREESWNNDVEAVTEAMEMHNRGSAGMEHFRESGFKMRCGGVHADHFPEAGQIAFALNRARDRELPVKGTAGLHHPVRHYSEQVKTKMYGFFNVFGGALLSWAHHLNDDEFEAVLCEEDPDRFRFSDDSFSYGEYSISAGEIEALREVALISYGSCSFDEPREDLEEMDLL